MFLLILLDIDFLELAQAFGLLPAVGVVVALLLVFLDVFVEQVLLETAAAVFLQAA